MIQPHASLHRENEEVKLIALHDTTKRVVSVCGASNGCFQIIVARTTLLLSLMAMLKKLAQEQPIAFSMAMLLIF